MLKRIFVGVWVLLGFVCRAADFQVGDKVEVKWGSVWYRAEVKVVEGPGRWKIGYDGYGANWDEIVGPERIRPRGAAAKPQATVTNTTGASATTASTAAPMPQETYPWPERPAGAKAGIEGEFLRVEASFSNGR